MTTTPTATASTPTLHRILGIGLVLLAIVFLALTYGGMRPLLAADGVTPPTIAYAFAGVAVAFVAVALFVCKPRVPNRGPGQSADEYWSTPEVSEKVVLVWFFLEGAGILAGVGYLLTGELAPVIAMGLAILVLWMFGPNAFANA